MFSKIPSQDPSSFNFWSSGCAAQFRPERQVVRVLLVDDDPVDIHLARHFLACSERFAAQIDAAGSIHEAKAFLLSTSYDLYIFDYWLKCQTTLRLIASMSLEIPSGRMLVLSGMTDGSTKDACIRAGAMHYLNKSQLSTKALDQVIAMALNA